MIATRTGRLQRKYGSVHGFRKEIIFSVWRRLKLQRSIKKGWVKIKDQTLWTTSPLWFEILRTFQIPKENLPMEGRKDFLPTSVKKFVYYKDNRGTLGQKNPFRLIWSTSKDRFLFDIRYSSTLFSKQVGLVTHNLLCLVLKTFL